MPLLLAGPHGDNSNQTPARLAAVVAALVNEFSIKGCYMVKRLFCLACLLLPLPAAAQEKKLPPPLVTGLKNPESVAVGLDGRIYITEIGEFNKDGDGRVMVVQNGQAVPFATGLDDPKGIV